MKKNIKAIISIIIFLAMLILITQNSVNAASQLRAKISNERYVQLTNGGFQKKKEYKINGLTESLFQILSVDSREQITGNNFYCLNAEVGNTWLNSASSEVIFDTPKDMVLDVEEIKNSSDLVDTYKSVVNNTNYKKILWILDHMYMKNGITKKQILENAGIVEDSDGTYYYDRTKNGNSVFSVEGSSLYSGLYGNPIGNGGYVIEYNGNDINVILSEEEIQAVQQAAIWYYTNARGNASSLYNCYTAEGSILPKRWFEYTENTTGDSNTDEIIKQMKQEQAAILYNYLIDSANRAGNNYESATTGTIDLEYTGAGTKAEMVESGSNYKIGPFKVTTTGNTTIKSVLITNGVNTTALSGAHIQNESGTTISKPVSGQDFYVIVPKTSVDSKVDIKVNASYTAIKKTLWLKNVTNNSLAEQPIVEYEPVSDDISANIVVNKEKQFDLALRKVITKVGTSSNILNEEGRDAKRILTIDNTAIPDTAIYKHRKDPIMVKEGDTITFELNVYNEGEIAGYALQIIDQLPTGLVPADLTPDTNGTGYLPLTVISSRGNNYVGIYDEVRNNITYTLVSASPESIPAYNSNNSELEKDTLEVKCKVRQQPATDGVTKHYLTNIAYISEECDEDDNIISQDRDSKGSVSPNKTADELNSTDADSYKGKSSNQSVKNDTNNGYYYEGEEDDDDFEKMVVMPKEFDLKLIKYISLVNQKTGDENKQPLRTITVDTSKLNQIESGKKITTAEYNVSKTPIVVEKGDTVTYTFRIYNEGELDGYAKEITENIPEGLKFVKSTDSDLTEYDRYAIQWNESRNWTLSDDGKTITTNYLSKTVSNSNLISAYNSDTMTDSPDYKEVSVILKVATDDATKVIRNEAEISKEEDENGIEIVDRDSNPEEWKKENSTTDFYDNNSRYPKYKEDDEDYDNVKLAIADLALRKFITKISSDGNFSNMTISNENRSPEIDSSKLKSGEEETAKYNHSKEPVYLNVGDYVLYTIRVYNEGDASGYASRVADYLPTYLDFVEDSQISDIRNINSKWNYDATSRVATTENLGSSLIPAYDKENDDGNGSGISSVDIQIICRVNDNAPSNRKLVNIAEITEYKNKNNIVIGKDRDSESANFPASLLDQESRPDYIGGEDRDRTDNYVPGQEDDDDFEKIILRGPSNYKVILIKEDKDGEELNSEAIFEVNNVTKNVTGHLTIADNVEINGSNVNTPDVYVIREIQAPDKYCKFDGTITITANKEQTEKSYKLKDLEYEIKDSTGTEITSENSNIYLKDGNIYVEVINYEEPEIHKGIKTVQNQDSGYDKDEEQTWVINSNIPEDIATYKKYEITDSIDYRLNFSGIDKVEVKIGNIVLTQGVDYKIDYIKNLSGITDKTNEGTLKITFVDKENSIDLPTNVKDNKGKNIEVKLKTTFAKDSTGNLLATFGTEVPNQAKLEFKNSTNISGEKLSENPEVHTGGVSLFKYYKLGEEKKALEGAEFAIYRTKSDAEENKNAIQTATSDSNGIIKFTGLQYGEDASDKEENKTSQGTFEYDSTKQSTKYWVAETKAPIKFALNTELIEVIVDSNSYKENVSEIRYEIENQKKPFDLKIIKYVSEVNGKISDREITVDTSNLNKTVDGRTITTAKYNVSKKPVSVKTGDYVTYTFRVYNEGEIDGYATEITENIPDGLEYDASANTDNMWEVSSDGKTIKTNYLANKLIKAFDGSKLDYEEVSVRLKVVNKKSNSVIRNEAEISQDKDKDGEDVEDRDSNPDEWKKENSDENYDDNNEYPKYKEDDEDYDNIIITNPDLAVRKFIEKASSDGNFKDEKTTTVFNREPVIDSSKLKDGTAKTAIYAHSKQPVSLFAGDYVLFTIRAYNEGSVDGYASQISDYLPDYLDFVESTDTQIKTINDNWSYDATTRKVTTKPDAPNALKKLKAFDKENDDGKGSGLYYVDVQIICKINKNISANKKITNIAEITEYKNENNEVVEDDEDSKPDNIKYPENPSTYKDDELDKDYVPGQEDDDDFEKIVIREPRKFDLALKKFITEVENEKITSRIPQVGFQKGKIVYNQPKDVVKLNVGNTVIYTLRVYNEGDISGFAEKISDDIPEYLEYLPNHSVNKEYRWNMYDKNGKVTLNISEAVKIVSDYTSKSNGESLMKAKKLEENPNLLNAFNSMLPLSQTNPDYIDIKVAFKVKDPGSNKIVITNKAQISENADEDGKTIQDIDSTPNIWKDGEDDQDYENVSVEYFDLSLLKYVTKAIVTENGKTKTTKTGNNGSSKDITPKVEIYRKNVNKVTVKFEYVIKITNEGDIAGYAKEITDYVPNGLKFYKEDNEGWTDEGNNIISTKLLQNTLLKPGESATVKVILRWINGSENLGVKINTAEISQDYNENNIPDRDSTPDNKAHDEDDIDDAPVLLTISTGELGHTIQIVTGVLVILVVVGLGIICIRKYVL